MSNDSNWLAPQNNDPEKTVVYEPAVTVVTATPLVSAAPAISAWVLLAFVGGLVSFFTALLILFSLPFVFFAPRSATANSAAITLITFSAAAWLGVPLAWWAWRRWRVPQIGLWRTDWFWVVTCVLLIVISLVAGQIFLVMGVALPMVGVAQSVATALGAQVVLSLVLFNWAGFSKLRVWGHFLSGAWLSVPIAFVIEIVLIGVFAILVFLWLALFVPSDHAQLLRLLQSLQSRATLPTTQLIPWLSKPWVVGLLFFNLSFLMPAIEELCKPIGVFLMWRRRPNSMEAFASGVLGGLGFAVIETLGNLSTLNREGWLALIVARFGTLVMHALTTGLVGWGIGQLATHGRWGRFFGAYFGAVTLHGLWNGAAITISLISLSVPLNDRNVAAVLLQAGPMLILLALCLLLLLALTFGGLAVLIGLGWRFRKQNAVT